MGFSALMQPPAGFSDDFTHDYFADHTYLLAGNDGTPTGWGLAVEGSDFSVAPHRLENLYDGAPQVIWRDPRFALAAHFALASISGELEPGPYWEVAIGFTAENSTPGDIFYPGSSGPAGFMFTLFGHPGGGTTNFEAADPTDSGDSVFASFTRAALPSEFAVSLNLEADGTATCQVDTQIFTAAVPSALMDAWAARALHPTGIFGSSGSGFMSRWGYGGPAVTPEWPYAVPSLSSFQGYEAAIPAGG